MQLIAKEGSLMGYYGNGQTYNDIGRRPGKKKAQNKQTGRKKKKAKVEKLSSALPVKVVPQVNLLSPEEVQTLNRFTHWFNHGRDSIERVENNWRTLHFKIVLSKFSIFERWKGSDRIIGLRFAKTTLYGVIDIDYGSSYHNEEKLRQIKWVLESIGIFNTILIRSSFSEGWHLYYFLPEAVGTFRLAQTVAIALRENGLELEAGQLEIFPNVKSFVKNGFSHYYGHRLPLQPGSGSDLLNKDFEPYSNSIDTFLSQAEQAALSVDFDVLSEALETAGDRYKELFKRASSDNVALSFKCIPHNKNARRWKEESETNYCFG
jgi:hypothetical protein